MIKSNIAVFFTAMENIDICLISELAQAGYQLIIVTNKYEEAKKTSLYGYTGQIRVLSLNEVIINATMARNLVKDSSIIMVTSSILTKNKKSDKISKIISYFTRECKLNKVRFIYLISPIYKAKINEFKFKIDKTAELIIINFSVPISANEPFLVMTGIMTNYAKNFICPEFFDKDIINILSAKNAAEKIIGIFNDIIEQDIYRAAYLIKGEDLTIKEFYQEIAKACGIDKARIFRLPKIAVTLMKALSFMLPARYNFTLTHSLLKNYFEWQKSFGGSNNNIKIIVKDNVLKDLNEIMRQYDIGQELDYTGFKNKNNDYYPLRETPNYPTHIVNEENIFKNQNRD